MTSVGNVCVELVDDNIQQILEAYLVIFCNIYRYKSDLLGLV